MSSSTLVFLFILLQVFHHSQASVSSSSRLQRRDPAIANSPSKNYAPIREDCPKNLVHQPKEAQISVAEQKYISKKASKSIPLWRDYLNRLNITDLNVEGFLYPANTLGGRAAETLPNFGFAFSGGGARALCVGASILDAMDGRNEKGVKAGVGGIVQLANYATGLSGGAWLLGSWATSDFPRLTTLNQTLWGLTEHNDLWDWNIAKHYGGVAHVIREKKKAHFRISIADVWGRILSRHFINDKSRGVRRQGQRVLWSSIRSTPDYKNQTFPYIIALTISRPGTRKPLTLSSPIYEYSPDDWSVWHPSLNATMPIDYLGSSPDALQRKSKACVRGFENAGFILGMSSNIFSLLDGPGKKSLLVRAINIFLDSSDYEGKVPNTFKGLGKSSKSKAGPFPDTDFNTILMSDAGLASETIPLFPLLQPSRRVDAIIAVDSTADNSDLADTSAIAYPNGTSLYMTYLKTKLPGFTGYKFPKIPNGIDGTFEKLGYTKRPTFFGCHDTGSTPIVIYLPNYYVTAKTDIPSTRLTYTGQQIDGFFDNGFHIATQIKKDPDWPKCLGCALIDRQFQRNGDPRVSQCEKCFERYCAKGF
ncbi:hypothetical protein CROQUDRAFT_666628 [Cronartium quercuum f. sp. fusiforme G11]|uniref:Lysophospholipase n=1 Tax=Cronartium quercuum f. sp. fusiforme G11 TaxID=708437 RepID=A0A9P6T5I5_9BASI|nr:hypothetical protein CROQUDRAFT_666628 [Cronartium quercuum f. sp. fusiforme G11]